MTRVLVVEDDPTLRMALEDALGLEGYEVLTASEGGLAEELLYARHFDLVVLDIMLPGRSGLEILRRYRDDGQSTPVVLLTARGDENDRVLGLELGADDYVTKPFSLRELLARIRGLLKKEQRIFAQDSAPAPLARLEIGGSEVDLERFLVRRDGREEAMTPKEAGMLRLLWEAEGRAVSRQRFLEEIWAGGGHVTNRTVDTHMLNLRRKLEVDPAKPQFLLTVHGVGYRLQRASDET